MSSGDVSILVASVWILNIQISESPLLILKEALHVIHNEIKREKNSLPSLSPPQALCPSFLARLYGCAEKRQGASKKRAMEKVTANETRAGGKKKNIDRGDKLRIFSTLVILCCSPNPRRRKSGSIIVLMDDWAFTGRPWNLHWGQEGRRLRGIREWCVDVCVLTLGSVWLWTFETLQGGNCPLKPILCSYAGVHACRHVCVCVTGWWWYMLSITQPLAWSDNEFSSLTNTHHCVCCRGYLLVVLLFLCFVFIFFTTD